MNNYNTTFKFNPQIYESQLSTYGKKILKVLVSQWHERNIANRSYATDHSFTKNFGKYDEPCQLPSSVHNKRFQEKKLHFIENEAMVSQVSNPAQPISLISNGTVTDVTNIPESTELLDDFNRLRNDSYKSFDFPTIEQTPNDVEIISDLVLSTTKENNNDNTNGTSVGNDNNLEDDDKVTWMYMFDTQLLPAEETAKSDKNHNLFQINFPHDTLDNAKTSCKKDKPISKESTSKTNKNNTTKCTSTKKRTITEITDIIPKKIKKPKTKSSNEIKVSTRKQNYSKSVNNWLDGVIPKNPDDEQLNPDPNILDVNGSSLNEVETASSSKKEKNNTAKKGIIEVSVSPPTGATKKTVQAKLTNKGGVMKYDKPKPSSSIIADKISKPKISEEGSKGNNLKEKKGKPKFVAPIKSQVPIKEIVYKINILDDNNASKLEIVPYLDNNEVYAVLIFSNGFNQLNFQYTDDDCIPEGILFSIDEYIFYLNGETNNFRDHVSALIDNKLLVCYGGKTTLTFLKLNMFDISNVSVLDTKIGGAMIDPDNPPDNFSELQKLLGYCPEFKIETNCPLQKAAWYITLLKENTTLLKSLLMENSLWKVFVEIEMKILPIIANMELLGVLVDEVKLKSMETILINKMKSIEQECYKAAGKKFQINSTVQVRSILYDELQLDTRSNVKIKETVMQGAKSTSETMLRSLTTIHPLPKLILEYRRLHKAHATFLTGIAQHVKNGVIRPTWEQTAAATGRIAANNPNIQAIPKALFSLSEDDCEGSSSPALNFRALYLARPGFVFLAADFQHVECRVFAHAAADETLQLALKSGQDLFRVLAAKWLKKPEQDISSEDRERTKRIIYASLYGAGARKLMDILSIGYDEALAVMTSFNRTFPSLKSFGRSVVSRCSQNNNKLGTLCGRVRHFNNICSADSALKSHAERQAVNFVVQGSAADLCKMAMVLTERNLRSARPAIEARLLLQIHDELVWEIKEEHLHRAAAIIQQSMQNCGPHCGLTVALPVAITSGRSWGEVQPFTIQ